jgi:hypothetical protein
MFWIMTCLIWSTLTRAALTLSASGLFHFSSSDLRKATPDCPLLWHSSSSARKLYATRSLASGVEKHRNTRLSFTNEWYTSTCPLRRECLNVLRPDAAKLTLFTRKLKRSSLELRRPPNTQTQPERHHTNQPGRQSETHARIILRRANEEHAHLF